MLEMLKIILEKLGNLFRGGGGLVEGEEDSRDFDFGAIFGFPSLKELPKEYRIPVLYWHDQKGSDMCTGFAVAEASEDQELKPLHPEFQFMTGKRIRGDWRPWGNSINAALKGAVKYGSIPLDFAPEMTLGNKSRNYLANWNNWSQKYWDEAKKYQKKSYFKVSNNRANVDKFDMVRIGLYGNRELKRTIVTGAYWRGNWSYPKNAIIPKIGKGGSIGHMFEIIGWKEIEGEPYLIIFPNYGHRFGDNGLIYMDRYVANRYLPFGLYALVDIPVDIAKILNQYANKVVGIGTPPLYLIQGGKKRHVPNQNVLNALGFKDELGEGGYQTIPVNDLDVIPKGNPVTTKDLSDPMQQLFHRNKLN